MCDASAFAKFGTSLIPDDCRRYMTAPHGARHTFSGNAPNTYKTRCSRFLRATHGEAWQHVVASLATPSRAPKLVALTAFCDEPHIVSNHRHTSQTSRRRREYVCICQRNGTPSRRRPTAHSLTAQSLTPVGIPVAPAPGDLTPLIAAGVWPDATQDNQGKPIERWGRKASGLTA